VTTIVTLGRTYPKRMDTRTDRVTPDGEEIPERGGHPRALELARGDDEELGYED